MVWSCSTIACHNTSLIKLPWRWVSFDCSCSGLLGDCNHQSYKLILHDWRISQDFCNDFGYIGSVASAFFSCIRVISFKSDAILKDIGIRAFNISKFAA
ncbi:unnamed protein product [Blepharisma stoltei]|uniref:Uncharacterized protein n=1 Tax=Blepharisma stoltei TaxID=1481888 RepID=A0AAU9IYQ6_9CILI|nr:unnamed protein product [Blepharisma stoltei]